MAALSSISSSSSVPAADTLNDFLAAHPGSIPLTTSCWNPLHPRHVWPTTPGTQFRIEDCEFFCFYCFKGYKYTGKYYSQPKRLREHVVEAHLLKGQFEGVNLMGIDKDAAAKRSGKKREKSIFADTTTDPQTQLSKLASILWLKPEHHTPFQCLVTIHLSGHTSELDTAISSFLKEFGPSLWPDVLARRHHLSTPSDPLLASYFRRFAAPIFVEHGKMKVSTRRRFIAAHGREPSESEILMASRMGKIVGRYGRIMERLGALEGALEVSRVVGEGESERLLGEIVGGGEGLMTSVGECVGAQRESSPDVPLRDEVKKRKRQEEGPTREGNPEMSLVDISTEQRISVVEDQRDSSPEVPLMSMPKKKRRNLANAPPANDGGQSLDIDALPDPTDSSIASFYDTQQSINTLDLPPPSVSPRSQEHPIGTSQGQQSSGNPGAVDHRTHLPLSSSGILATPHDARLSTYREPLRRLDPDVPIGEALRQDILSSTHWFNYPPSYGQPEAHLTQPHGHVTIDPYPGRDSVLQPQTLQPSTQHEALPFLPPGMISHNPSQYPSSYQSMPMTTRVCVLRTDRPSIEVPTIENTLNAQAALLARSASVDVEFSAAQRARFQIYRRRTGGFGGLPVMPR